MINGVYGGIMYPHSSFVFDKVYDNYTAMMNGKVSDGVLVGRYVLISYCDVPLTQDDRNAFEAIACGATPKEGWTMPENSTDYLINYKIDNGLPTGEGIVTKKNPISYDKTVYRKSLKSGVFAYEHVASLNSTVSDESIIITGLKKGDKVLSINKRVLQSDLNLTHNRTTDKLILSGNQQINDIPISPMIADHLKTDKYLKYGNDNKLYVDISELVYDSNTKTIRLKDASGMNDKDSISTVAVFKDRVDYNNDRLLFFTDNDKLATGISLVYMPDSKVIQLLDKNDSCISEIDTTDFVKDGMIQSVTLESQDGDGNPGQFLKIVWNTDADVDSDDVTYVDITTLVDAYTSGNAAINIDSTNKIFLTLDSDSENFITISNKGLKLSGVNSAIQKIKEEVDKKLVWSSFVEET